MRVWDVESGTERFTVTAGWKVNDVDWSPTGEVLAVAGGSGDDEDGIVTVFDRHGEIVTTIDEFPGESIEGLRFTPDGESLILVIHARRAFDPNVARIEVRDRGTGAVESTIYTEAVGAIPDPTGRIIATAPHEGADDQAVSLWDAGTGRVVARLEGSTGFILGMAFDPTGTQIATASQDGTVRLWDPESGQERLTLPGHLGQATSVSFDSTGTRLATSGSDGVVRVWMLDPDELAEIVRAKVTRDFTEAECRHYLHRDSCPAER